MPRNGSGTYSLPPNTAAGPPNSTISSAKANSVYNDIAADLNTARPIVAGGTGATNAVDSADAFSTKGADIASAGTTDIGAASGRYVHITGTSTITSFGTKTAGVVRILTFDGALTLTHNATSLILPGGANILTAAGDTAVVVSEGGGNWRCVTYSRAAGVSVRATPGHLYGMTLANNVADATNDIDIAAGEVASDGATPYLMALGSVLTKRLDAAWAVGTNQGGLDAGSIANNTYHIWIIQRSDTGVVDALFSTSATSPTMPANYDRKRRIGAIRRESGVIWPFKQDSDFFELVSPTSDVTTVTTSVALRTIRTPAGLPFRAQIAVSIANSAGAMSAVNHWNPALGSTLPSSQSGLVQTFVNQTVVQAANEIIEITTNSSAQIYNQANGSNLTSYSIVTLGYWDHRGRD